MGCDSSVDIVTRYRMDGPGIESRWGAKLPAPVQTGTRAHPASYTKGTGSKTVNTVTFFVLFKLHVSTRVGHLQAKILYKNTLRQFTLLSVINI